MNPIQQGYIHRLEKQSGLWPYAAGLAGTGGLGALLGALAYDDSKAGALYGLSQGIGMPLGAALGSVAVDQASQKGRRAIESALALDTDRPLGQGYDAPLRAGGMVLGGTGAKRLIDLLWGKDKPV